MPQPADGTRSVPATDAARAMHPSRSRAQFLERDDGYEHEYEYEYEYEHEYD